MRERLRGERATERAIEREKVREKKEALVEKLEKCDVFILICIP